MARAVTPAMEAATKTTFFVFPPEGYYDGGVLFVYLAFFRQLFVHLVEVGLEPAGLAVLVEFFQEQGMFYDQLVDIRVATPHMFEEFLFLGEHFPADVAFDGV